MNTELNELNSIEKYDLFLRNAGISKTIQGLIESLLIVKEKISIVDIGCGNCSVLIKLKQLFKEKIKVIGVDLKELKAKEIDFFFKGNFLEVNLTEFSHSIDLILCFRAAHLIGESKEFIEKIFNLLSLKGKALLLIRITEIKENELKFAGKLKEKDLKYLMNLTEKKSAKFNGKKFKLKVKKRFLDLSVLNLKEEDLKEFGEKKILYGLSLFIERIK